MNIYPGKIWRGASSTHLTGVHAYDYFAPGMVNAKYTRCMQSIVISVSVCLLVCLKDHVSNSRYFLCMLTVAVGGSSCDDNATRYVLPVLR